MFTDRGVVPLTYRRLAPCELDRLGRLHFTAGQIERFLGPLADIVAAVRRGPAHQLIAIERDSEMIGFFAVHPDPRNAACWWLGWFGIDRRHQGGGVGRAALAAIVERLRQLPGVREVRLLVAPDNAAALRLYRRAGFLLAGWARRSGEMVLGCLLRASRPSAEVPARFWADAILLQVVDARRCRMGVPAGAELHGEVAFPP